MSCRPTITTCGRWAKPAGVALALGAIVMTAWAGEAAEPNAAAPVAQPDYHPSLADIMTMAIQPRHIKLGFAGEARNWTYLAYEASELRNAFNRVARTIPSYRKTDLAEAFTAYTKAPLDQMDVAIKARDGAALDAAYGGLTQGCNGCHQGLDHAEIVIKAPAGPAFADQSFDH